MALPPSLRAALRPELGELSDVRAVGGGDTSAAIRATSARAGEVFVKYSGGGAGETYTAEADGLAALSTAVEGAGLTEVIAVPEPLAYASPDGERPGYLVLPWLAATDATAGAWARFGEALAVMHAHGSDAVAGYGWSCDNFLGPEPQPNAPLDNWVDFFRERRLLAMAERMRARGRWRPRWDGLMEALSRKLDTLLPAAPAPALLHGDLWAGNAMALADGRFALVDPAVYVGHHEVDLAMTALFGGYPAAFYEGYGGAGQHEDGFAAFGKLRAGSSHDLYQLYYLIMHLGVGPGYEGRVETTLRRYGG